VPRKELAHDRDLARFLQQEAVVSVGRFDNVQLDQFPPARSAAAISSEPDGGYSQSELNAMRSVRAVMRRTASTRRPPPCWRARSKYDSARDMYR
jgi:hypothetical protein